MIDLGKRRTCDVCGANVFIRRNLMSEHDYFDDDKDWEYINGIGDICPDCAKAYHTMVDSLIEERGGVPDESNDQD